MPESRNKWGILESLVGIAVAILVGSIPWAYTMQGRVTRIETTLTTLVDAGIVQMDLRERIFIMEQKKILPESEQKFIIVEKKIEVNDESIRDIIRRLDAIKAAE